MTIKIQALTDTLGNLVHFELLLGQRLDTIGVEPLLDRVTFGGMIGENAFDINTIITDLKQRGAKIVICQHPRRVSAFRIDRDLYQWCHLIENFFRKLK
jgi:hypothetical protein